MNIYLQIVIAICAVSASTGIAFAQFRKGTRTESGDIIKFYKEQSDNYKDMMEKKEAAHNIEVKEITQTFTEKVNALTREVGELRGQYNAEKKQREQYEEILKDKNPETEQFMKLMIKAVDDQSKINKEVVSLLGEIHTMSKAEHDRDFKIEATLTKK